jgi:hypothetical protein
VDYLRICRAIGLDPGEPLRSIAHEKTTNTNGSYSSLTHCVMAGLVPAVHVFDSAQLLRRGCPRQARA